MELTLKEAEVTKLNLQPGEALVVTIKSDERIGDKNLSALREMFNDVFPNNKTIVLAMGPNNKIDFSVIKDSEDNSCSTGNYCDDCNCGKKESFDKGE